MMMMRKAARLSGEGSESTPANAGHGSYPAPGKITINSLPIEVQDLIGTFLFSAYEPPKGQAPAEAVMLSAAKWAAQLARVGSPVFTHFSHTLDNLAVDPGCEAARATAQAEDEQNRTKWAQKLDKTKSDTERVRLTKLLERPPLACRTRCPVRPRARRLVAHLLDGSVSSLITASDAMSKLRLSRQELDTLLPVRTEINRHHSSGPLMRLFDRAAVIRLANQLQPKLDAKFWTYEYVQKKWKEWKETEHQKAMEQSLQRLGLTRAEARLGLVGKTEARLFDTGEMGCHELVVIITPTAVISHDYHKPLLNQVAGRLYRRKQLQAALAAHDMVLRSGSSRCAAYLKAGTGTLEAAVAAMEEEAAEHTFFTQHTEYNVLAAVEKPRPPARAGPAEELNPWDIEELKEQQMDGTKKIAFARWLKGFASAGVAAAAPELPASMRARVVREWPAPTAAKIPVKQRSKPSAARTQAPPANTAPAAPTTPAGKAPGRVAVPQAALPLAVHPAANAVLPQTASAPPAAAPVPVMMPVAAAAGAAGAAAAGRAAAGAAAVSAQPATAVTPATHSTPPPSLAAPAGLQAVHILQAFQSCDPARQVLGLQAVQAEMAAGKVERFPLPAAMLLAFVTQPVSPLTLQLIQLLAPVQAAPAPRPSFPQLLQSAIAPQPQPPVTPRL